MPQSIPSWLTSIALPWVNEETSVFGRGPLIVVDVGEAAQLATHRAELGAAILVGVDEKGALPETADIFDILLTTAPAPPRPWVEVRSIAAALESLDAAVKSNPHAAVTLVQVLRAQKSVSFETALLIESFAYSTLLGGSEFRRWRAAKPRGAHTHEPDPPVLVERDADTMRIILSRPGSENGMTAELRDHLIEALRAARLDDAIKMVEIRGQGRVFCSGGAFDEFGTNEDLALAHQIRTVRSVALALHRLDARSRVIIQGAAVGSGIEFAAAAREVIAHPAAFFMLPEVSMGLIPGAGGTVTIARRIGWQRTCYMALIGTRLRTRTALAWGLIDRLKDA
ncbi:MAG: enoyl-CoA hydratase/isomerase family protein [Rhodospirillaceae bacterium]|nr:MAG: enoyl-CoA hydratase/isomerase family protein [Rhodospirillaceae bacterium]